MHGFKYHFGLPGKLVWGVHIFLGLIFISLGGAYMGLKDTDPVNAAKISEVCAILLLIMGSLMAAYHGHLMYLGK